MSENGTGTAARPAPGTARTAVVWEDLRELIAELSGPAAEPLRIVDAGGGTGGAAVPLAALGHTVTVVEPSPDSLAALERRAAEAGVRVRALQGDTVDLPRLLDGEQADLVLLHNVLEYVDDPAAALADAAGLLRPGGALSVLAANVFAAALHRVLLGGIGEARHLLDDAGGRWGDADPMPRRFTAGTLGGLVAGAGLAPPRIRGAGVFADLVPGRAYDAGAVDESALVALEREATGRPELAGVAAQLHAVAHRPGA
ncbi:methyltransferase domain-containing protein [Nocardiopsis coralliicola]